MKGTLSYIIISILPNSHFGKRLVARDMISFSSDVGTQIVYFLFFVSFVWVYKPWEVFHRISHKI